MPRPALLAAAVTAVAAALVTAACADEADPADVPSGGGTATVAEGLAALPDDLGDASGDDAGGDDSGYATYTWSDLDRAAELAGVERPEDEGDVLAVADYVSAISGGPTGDGEPSPVVALLPETSNVYGAAHELAEFRDEVGWNVLDVDSFAEQDAPPVARTVMSGEFDPAAITQAMGEPDDGTWSVGRAGEVSPENVTPARPLGQALYLTEVGAGLAVSRGEDHTGQLRAVAGGDREASVAADDTMAAVAGALDDAGAYSAMIVRPGLTAGGDGLSPRASAAQCEASPQVPTLATATGIADDGGPVILVVEAYGSAGDAEAGADALEQVAADGESLTAGRPWSDLVEVEGVDTTGPDGTVAVVRLRPTEDGRASLWRDLILQRDNLVAHC